jgi:hypothetical protein
MPVIRISNEAYQKLLSLQAEDGNTMSVFFDRFVAGVQADEARLKAKVAADHARLKAKVDEEAKVAVKRQLEAIHDTGKPKGKPKPKPKPKAKPRKGGGEMPKPEVKPEVKPEPKPEPKPGSWPWVKFQGGKRVRCGKCGAQFGAGAPVLKDHEEICKTRQ